VARPTFARRPITIIAGLVLAMMVIGSCGDSSEPIDGASETSVSGPLTAVCPSPLVIQTDWFPESEHGALYELMGGDYVVDADQKRVSGSMVSQGTDLGIDWEVRTGGPAIGFAPVASIVYSDDSIHLAYADTDLQILSHADVPLLSVAAPLEINPQVVLWDPERYPEVETVADLGDQGIEIVVDDTTGFSRVFTALGVWDSAQLDPSYDGSPTRLIATDGEVAVQAFASAEPFDWARIPEWDKPLSFDLLHNGGFEIYSQTIAIRPDDQETLSPCLEAVVPVIQQAVVDFISAPYRANAIIIDAVETFADFWTYDQALADYSVATQTDLGLVGNGPDDTVGNLDDDRVQGVIDLLRQADMDVPADLSADELFTNEYIDPDIGFR